MTREEWLAAATAELQADFRDAGFDYPPRIRVACGWPSKSALSRKRRRIGECWTPEASADKTFEILISPCLADPVEVLEVLVHELCHAVVGVKAGHRGPFVKAAKGVGLLGPWTATKAGPELKQRLNAVSLLVGEYPHAKLDALPKERVQGTRMLKVVCPDCGYTVRTTRKWLDQGLPSCPCGEEMGVAA